MQSQPLIQNSNLEALLRCLSFLTSQVLARSGETGERAATYGPDWRAGKAWVEALFEIASELELGELVQGDELLHRLDHCAPSESFLILDLEQATVKVVDQQSLLSGTPQRWLSTAIVKVAEPAWIYWRPVGTPHRSTRLLEIPRWQSNVYSMSGDAT